MEVRETLQNGTVYRRRGDSREAITRATFTRFENRCATFFGRFAIQHFTFTAASAPRKDYLFPSAGFANPFHQLIFNLRGHHFGTVIVEDTRMFNHILIPGDKTGTAATVTCHAGSRRTGVISKGKLRQRQHACSELVASGFADIFRSVFDSNLRQRLNCELFICFADAGLAEESSQAEACTAAGGTNRRHNISARETIRRGSLYIVADMHSLRTKMFECCFQFHAATCCFL